VKIAWGAVRAGLAAILVLAAAAAAGARDARPATDPAADPADGLRFREANIERVRSFLASASTPQGALDDYYFVLIGDVQNTVRDFRHDVFNALARKIREETDAKTGERLYDRIKFIVLNGDLVYEGPSTKEWAVLEKALAGKGPDGASYPYLELLAREKPFFPVLGNHELLSFRLYPQNRYKDLFDSPLGVSKFKSFVDWDRWIADPHILYPVPADLPADAFLRLTAGLSDAADRRLLDEAYALKPDGRRRLKFFDNPPRDAAEFQAASDRLAAGLAAVFRKAGYGTLPVLSSDDMIHYAFEAGGALFVVLDSLARGWQYPGFARLKETLYPAKKDQHRLNLFAVSPFNGQAGFFRAAAAYARERGLTMVPMMHSPVFNSSRNVYQSGLGYSSWLALGFPQPGSEKGDPTIFDDIIFSDVPCQFSSCIHGYEHFTVVARTPGAPDHALQCYISGGGGGPLRGNYIAGKTGPFEELYNLKLKDIDPPGAARSIEIRDDVTGVGHHYLLVHVSGGRVVEVTPRFIELKELGRRKFNPQLTLTTAYLSSPATTAASLEFSLGAWGMEDLAGFLTFAKWRPSVSVGVVDYNLSGRSPFPRAYAAVFDLSPFNVECHLPRANLVTLKLLGFELWDGRSDLRRAFLTTGIELPLFYDLFGCLERLNVGVKIYFPFHAAGDDDQEFGRRTKVAVYAGYRFRF